MIFGGIPGIRLVNSLAVLGLVLVVTTCQNEPLQANPTNMPLSGEMTDDSRDQQSEDNNVLQLDHSMIISFQLTLHHLFYEIKVIEFDQVEDEYLVRSDPTISRNLERILFRRVISANAP